MNTKKPVCLGLIFAAVVAVPAFAIPVAFDFTGTVRQHSFIYSTGEQIDDTSWIGQDFTAQLVIDTDRYLSPPVLTDGVAARSLLLTTDEGAPAAWYGSLTIAGSAIDVQPYARNYSALQVSDSKGPMSCDDGCMFVVPDALSLVARSDLQGPFGTQRSSLFHLVAYQDPDFTNPDPSIYTYVDLDQPFSPESLLSMALPNLDLSYRTSNFNCQERGCFFGSAENTYFNVTSVTRTDLSAVSVPEPATLGLIGFGLFAARLSRRHRKSA